MSASSTTITATETQKIEAALNALLAAAIIADRTPEYRVTPPRGPVSFGELAREWLDSVGTATPAQRAAAELFDNPVSEVLLQAVTTLGRRLHEIGGMRAMHDALNRICDLDPRTEGHREGIMNHRWSGIGEWMA